MNNNCYIETTIPSFYFDTRNDCILRHEITQEWWNSQRQHFHCFTSIFTLFEVQNGDYPNKESVIALTKSIELLSFAEEIDEIIEVYMTNFVMPQNALGDAAHLAVASYHSMDYLLTWNCKHLANASIYDHIQKINLKLGLITPMIITPEQLFPEADNA